MRMKYQPCPGYEEVAHLAACRPDSELRHHFWALYWLARTLARPGRPLIELGVRAGDSTRALLCAVRDLGELRERGDPGARLISWDVAGDAYNVKEITKSQGCVWVDGIWECNQGDGANAGRHWQGGLVDMVFIDTSHEYEQTRAEIAAWHPHVRIGGALAFHDTRLTHPGLDGVRPAIDEFLTRHDDFYFEDHGGMGSGDTGFGILWRER